MKVAQVVSGYEPQNVMDACYVTRWRFTMYFFKYRKQSSSEIEYFVKTHLCKLCDTPIARITSCVSSLGI